MAQRLKGYLRLMRPANVVTAIADVLAGCAIAGYFASKGFENILWQPVLWLCLATAFLYAGGVVLNDVFDATLDAVERPERPIPSGVVLKKEATLFGALLLLLGIAASFFSKGFLNVSVFIALAIAAASIIYDGWGKHHTLLGPLNMGLCRGLNLALGISIVPVALQQHWYLGFVPIVYIAAITAISRGEVHGGSRRVLYGAAFLYTVVISAVAAISFLNGNLPITLPFLLLFGVLIFWPLQKAMGSPVGPRIGKAVKAGVLALIAMNAAWAAAFGAPFLALLILLLLPLSLYLARLFAVT